MGRGAYGGGGATALHPQALRTRRVANQDDSVVQLTDEQVEAAKAIGCSFVEATEAQVRQFAMQRRIFQHGGKPYLAARADGFYETAGTLMARIAEVMKQRAAAPADEPVAIQAEEAPQPAEAPAVEDVEPTAEAQVVEDEETAAEAQAVEDVEPATEAPEPPSEAAPASLVEEAPVEPPARPERSSAVMAAMKTIAKGYAQGQQVDAAQLSTLLTTVHRTLSALEVTHPHRPRSDQ